MTPLVTCVVCAYDYGAYVEAAVRSVLGQRGLPDGALEVIVVDDGSTDETPQILASFGDAITVIRQQNAGPAVATNRAIAQARGRYVSLLDADDEWLPDKLARHVALLEAHPEIGLVHGDMEVIDGAGRPTRPSKYDWYGELPVIGRALGRLLAQNEATTSSITLRTDLAQAIPPTPAWAWCRDWWLAAHVAATHEVDALRDPVARYRIHGDNVSAQDAHSERAVRLWERDLRVRRLLLRDLDLRNATLDELAVAWARFAGFLQKVAQVRGIGQRDVVPVAEEDRREAEGQRERARALLASAGSGAVGGDAGGDGAVSGGVDDGFRAAIAGRAAIKAMAADPFDPASAQLFEAARRADPGPVPTTRERERAFAELRAAVVAPDATRARRHAARALVLDPADDHARALLELPRTAPRTARDATQHARFHQPPAAALDGARAFVALAFADELAGDPDLLRAWAAAFGAADDATLAIVTADADVAAVHGRIAAALDAAGLAAEDGRDLALVLAAAGSDAEAALARQAHAVLARRPAERAFTGHPRADGSDPAVLRVLAERRWSHDGLGAPLSFAIKICPQRWDGAERWGDTHFARALADELTRRGHRARLDVVAEWDTPAGARGGASESARGGVSDSALNDCGAHDDADIAIHLRGLFPYVPRPDQINVLWNISHPDLVTTAELDAYDLAFTPSARHAEQIAPTTSTPVALLEQATDPVTFFPEHDPAHARELVFVGNSRGIMRPILRDLLPTPHDLAVWGQQWERFLPAGLVQGEHLPNEAVRRAYSSAAIVLNDHWDDMRTQGIVSNRVYDALACGALVVSDHLSELAERFGDAVVTYRTPEELRAHVARLLADPDERAERAARGRDRVLAHDTFRHRVDALLDAIAAQRAPTALKTAAPRPILCT